MFRIIKNNNLASCQWLEITLILSVTTGQVIAAPTPSQITPRYDETIKESVFLWNSDIETEYEDSIIGSRELPNLAKAKVMDIGFSVLSHATEHNPHLTFSVTQNLKVSKERFDLVKRVTTYNAPKMVTTGGNIAMSFMYFFESILLPILPMMWPLVTPSEWYDIERRFISNAQVHQHDFTYLSLPQPVSDVSPISLSLPYSLKKIYIEVTGTPNRFILPMETDHAGHLILETDYLINQIKALDDWQFVESTGFVVQLYPVVNSKLGHVQLHIDANGASSSSIAALQTHSK